MVIVVLGVHYQLKRLSTVSFGMRAHQAYPIYVKISIILHTVLMMFVEDFSKIKFAIGEDNKSVNPLECRVCFTQGQIIGWGLRPRLENSETGTEYISKTTGIPYVYKKPTASRV